MKLTLASPEHAELITEFYQSVHDESFPHREMFSAQVVRRLLRDQELAVVVAFENRKIIGCGLGFPQAWNQSLEMGSLSVDDVPGRGQVGKALFEGLRRLGLKQYGLALFRARTEAAFRRGRNVGAVCWGYWPAPGKRTLSEADLIMGIFDDWSLPPQAIDQVAQLRQPRGLRHHLRPPRRPHLLRRPPLPGLDLRGALE